MSTAYPFFAEGKALDLVFRKRVLHKEAGIGLHQHDKADLVLLITYPAISTR